MLSPKRILGILLISAGVAALVHPGLPMPRKSHRTDLGPLQIKVMESRQVEVPKWLSAIVVMIGTGVLVIEKRR